jgi:hypothetical protein
MAAMTQTVTIAVKMSMEGRIVPRWRLLAFLTMARILRVPIKAERVAAGPEIR